MSDWWSKKLAGEKPPIDRSTLPPVNVPLRFPQTQQPSTPSTAHTAPQNDAPAESLSEALQRGITNGGEARRKDNITCPECGSAYVFSRTKGGMVNGASPAPRCYECGWNGLYDQAQQAMWSS